MTPTAIASFLILLASSALLTMQPHLTRPDVFFGVTVAPLFRRTDAGMRIVRNYRTGLWCAAAAAAAVTLLSDRASVALLLYVTGVFATFVAANRAAQAHASAPSPIIEVDLAARTERLPGGWVSATLPLCLLLALGAWAASHWDQLPERLVVHWGPTGPDRWMHTTPQSVATLLAGFAFSCLVLTGAAVGVLLRTRRIATSAAAAAGEQRFRRRIVLVVLVSEYFLALLPVLILFQAPWLAVQAWIAAMAIALIASVAGAMSAGQGGTRLAAAESKTAVGDRTPDRRWIWGMVYVNPSDSALLVEKRFGVGYTVNFGNPWVWAPLAVLAVPLLLRLL